MRSAAAAGATRVLGARPGRRPGRPRAAHRPGLAGAEFRGVGRFRRLKAAEGCLTLAVFIRTRRHGGRDAPDTPRMDVIAQTQFLHHRPRRPRQDDALRPAARIHPHGHAAGDEGPDARLDGPGEGAGHHDQDAPGDHALPGEGREDLPAQPDGHAGPRGLLLRGLAFASRPARARSCWSTRPRASRRRPWPTPTWRSRQKLKVIPVINKIDLPSANLELCTRQLEDILTIPAEEVILASGKSGIGISEILEAIVARVPPPRWADYPGTRILVFDSKYDSYRGVIAYVRVFSGTIKAGDMMMLMSTGQKAEVKEVGVFHPEDGARATSWAPATSATSSATSRPRAISRSATRSPTPPGPPPRCCPATRRCSRWSTAGCIRWRPRTTRSSRRRSPACGSTTRRSSTSRRPRSRSASASAAASSASCTWRSSRSASAASTTWTSSPPIRASSTR